MKQAKEKQAKEKQAREEQAKASSSEVARVAKRAVPSWCEHEIRVIEYLEGGYSHDNYRLEVGGEHYALRIAGTVENLAFEDHWWRKLPSGVSPELIALDPQSGAQVTRWVDGPLLLEATVTDAMLVSYLRDLHCSLPDPVRHCDLATIIQGWLQPDAAQTAQKAFASLPQPAPGLLAPCHNDLNPWNVVCSPRRWITLDWEMAGRNDPLFDVLALAFGLERSLQDARALCEAYLGQTIDSARLQHVSTAFWLREYAWAFNAVKHGNKREEVARQEVVSLEWLRQLTS